MKNKKTIIFLLTFLLAGFTVWSQQKTVIGTVVDGSGLPLPGVVVLEVGTSNGTQSDFDGNFSINVQEDASLEFSYVGMLTQVLSVSGKDALDITMSDDLESLSEVVVTGYSAQTKGTLSAAVSVVGAEELTAVPISSASQGLQGRVAGVNVASGSGPGGGTSVRIRGYSSINNNEPLYVVDGVPLQGDINLLNPNDIESMTVLKDASASIYGSRAAAGVILITTRKGKSSEKNVLSYNGYYGMQRAGKLYKTTNPTSQAYIDYLDASYQGLDYPSLYGGGITPVLPDYLNGDPNEPYDLTSNYLIKANKEGTDWIEEVFTTSPIQNHQITASGAGKKGNYLFSGGYFNQEGIVSKTGYDRLTARVNSNYNIRDHIRVGESITVSYGQRKGYIYEGGAESPVSMAYRMPSIIPVYDEGGNYAGTKAKGLGNAKNPVAILDRRQDDRRKNVSVLGSAYLEFDFLKDFTFKTNIGVNYTSNYDTEFTSKEYENSENIGDNSFTESYDYAFNTDWYNTLSWSKTLADVHAINAFIGYEVITDVYRNMEAGRTTFPYETEDFRVLDGGTKSQSNSGTQTEYGLTSFFGKLDYVFDSKYILSATLRQDASSRFTGDNRSQVFPSVSVAWNISNESFLSDAGGPIGDLKLRASWGKLGNQGIDARYPTFSTYSQALDRGGYDIGGSNSSLTTGYYASNTGNEDIGWETSVVTDIGLDVTLFDNIDFTFDYFIKTTEDILYNPELPATQGTDAVRPYINIGSMENTGFDFSLGYRDTKGDFGYGVTLNFSHYTNEVTKISSNEKAFINGNDYRDIQPTRTEKGQPISSFYGYQVLGIFQTDEEVENSPTQENSPAPGRYKYKDVNGDGKVDAEDRAFIGSPHPDFTYGLNLDFSYKNFDLTMFFQGSQGNDIFNATRYYTDFATFYSAKNPELVNDSWTTFNTDAKYPTLVSDATVIGFEKQSSTHYIEDGSYIRLKNLQLGYNLDGSILTTLGLSSARVYLQAQNLLTITAYTGMDPEISTNEFYNDTADFDIGVDRGVYPNSVSYLVGLNISL